MRAILQRTGHDNVRREEQLRAWCGDHVFLERDQRALERLLTVAAFDTTQGHHHVLLIMPGVITVLTTEGYSKNMRFLDADESLESLMDRVFDLCMICLDPMTDEPRVSLCDDLRHSLHSQCFRPDVLKFCPFCRVYTGTQRHSPCFKRYRVRCIKFGEKQIQGVLRDIAQTRDVGICPRRLDKRITTIQCVLDYSGSMYTMDMEGKTRKQVALELVYGLVSSQDPRLEGLLVNTTAFASSAQQIMSSGIYPVFFKSDQLICRQDGDYLRAICHDVFDLTTSSFVAPPDGPEEARGLTSVADTVVLEHELVQSHRKIGSEGFVEFLMQRLLNTPMLGGGTQAYLGCSVANQEIARLGSHKIMLNTTTKEKTSVYWSFIPLIITDGELEGTWANDIEKQYVYSVVLDGSTEIVPQGIVIRVGKAGHVNLAGFPAAGVAHLAQADQVEPVLEWIAGQIRTLQSQTTRLEIENPCHDATAKVRLTCKENPSKTVYVLPGHRVYVDYWEAYQVEVLWVQTCIPEIRLQQLVNQQKKAMVKGKYVVRRK